MSRRGEMLAPQVPARVRCTSIIAATIGAAADPPAAASGRKIARFCAPTHLSKELSLALGPQLVRPDLGCSRHGADNKIRVRPTCAPRPRHRAPQQPSRLQGRRRGPPAAPKLTHRDSLLLLAQIKRARPAREGAGGEAEAQQGAGDKRLQCPCRRLPCRSRSLLTPSAASFADIQSPIAADRPPGGRRRAATAAGPVARSHRAFRSLDRDPRKPRLAAHTRAPA